MRLVLIIGHRNSLNDEKLQDITDIVQDEQAAKVIISFATLSMGTDISEGDMENIFTIANQILELVEFRDNLEAIAKTIKNEK